MPVLFFYSRKIAAVCSVASRYTKPGFDENLPDPGINYKDLFILFTHYFIIR